MLHTHGPKRPFRGQHIATRTILPRDLMCHHLRTRNPPLLASLSFALTVSSLFPLREGNLGCTLQTARHPESILTHYFLGDMCLGISGPMCALSRTAQDPTIYSVASTSGLSTNSCCTGGHGSAMLVIPTSTPQQCSEIT